MINNEVESAKEINSNTNQMNAEVQMNSQILFDNQNEHKVKLSNRSSKGIDNNQLITEQQAKNDMNDADTNQEEMKSYIAQ